MKKRLVTFLSSYEEMNLNSLNSVSPNDGTIDNDVDSTLKQIIKESYRVSISNHERERGINTIECFHLPRGKFESEVSCSFKHLSHICT